MSGTVFVLGTISTYGTADEGEKQSIRKVDRGLGWKASRPARTFVREAELVVAAQMGLGETALEFNV